MKEKKHINQHNFLISRMREYFRFDTSQAILKKEIIGGLSTFLAMCYILAVNPTIVGGAPIDGIKYASEYSGGLFLVTAISSFIGTFVMGLWARLPIAVAPGMGLNAFFAYSVAKSVGFGSALTITIISGILYFLIVMTPLRNKISELIPTNFKIAVGSAIGLFIAYLGLQNSGIISGDSPLLTKIGDLSNPLIGLGLGLIFLALILHFSKVPGSILLTMLVGAIVMVILCTTKTIVPKDANGNTLQHFGLLGSYGDFGSFKDVAKAGWLGFANVDMWKNPMTYFGVLSFLYMDFFDTTGSLLAINRMVGFDKVDKNWMTKANYVDALSTIAGAGIGATTVTTFVESSVGVSSGAKTGFASIITSLMFALSIALWPILQVFMPINNLQPITSPALIIVGAMMMSQIRHFEWEIFVDIPMMFITLLMMTLTNSIAHGLSFGMITFVLMNLSLGIAQKIKNRKKVVNDITIPISDTGIEVNVREFNYLKRLNSTCISIAFISLIYIILEAGSKYWF